MTYNENRIQDIPAENPEALMLEYKKTGNLELRNKLVMHYLQRVNIAIYSMRSILLSNIPFEDFFDQGVLALMECIDRYDPQRGASFDTYCYTAIRGSILKYLRKQNWLPNRVWEARKKLKKISKELEQKLQREPTIAELAKEMGLGEEKLKGLMLEMSSVDTVSFEKLIEQAFCPGGEELSLAQTEEIDKGLMEQELRQQLIQAIDRLPAKQKQVIALAYHENLNLKEIGKVLDITPQRVSQIRKKALEFLSIELQKYEYDAERTE